MPHASAQHPRGHLSYVPYCLHSSVALSATWMINRHFIIIICEVVIYTPSNCFASTHHPHVKKWYLVVYLKPPYPAVILTLSLASHQQEL